jgi:hypothetical protein
LIVVVVFVGDFDHDYKNRLNDVRDYSLDQEEHQHIYDVERTMKRNDFLRFVEKEKLTCLKRFGSVDIPIDCNAALVGINNV